MTFGSWGEEVAAKYLISKGYLIIEKNFRCKIGEIDIVAKYDKTLVFIEVKSRRNTAYGLPCEAVTKTKIRHIKRNIAAYTLNNSADDMDMRIDVIEVLRKDEKTYIHHIENIF